MTSSERQLLRLNQSFSSGVHYWEFVCPVSCANLEFGVVQTGCEPTCTKFKNSTPRVVGVLLDLYTQRMAFYLNGRLQEKKVVTLWPGNWQPAVWLQEKDTIVVLNPYCQGGDLPYTGYIHHTDWAERLSPWVCLVLPTPNLLSAVLTKLKAQPPLQVLNSQDTASLWFLFQPREACDELVTKVRESGEQWELYLGAAVAGWLSRANFVLNPKIESIKTAIHTQIALFQPFSNTIPDFKSVLFACKSPRILTETVPKPAPYALYYLSTTNKLLAVCRDQIQLVPIRNGQFKVSALLFTEPQSRSDVVWLQVERQEIVAIADTVLGKVEELGLSSEALGLLAAMEGLVEVDSDVYMRGRYEDLVKGVLNLLSAFQVSFPEAKEWQSDRNPGQLGALSTLLRLEEELRVRQPPDCTDLWPTRTIRLHTAISRLTSLLTTPGASSFAQAGVINTKDWLKAYCHSLDPSALLSSLSALERQLPDLGLLQARPSANVPLSVSIAGPARRHPGLGQVSVKAGLVMTFSPDGCVRVWDTSLYLVEIACLDVTQLSASVPEPQIGEEKANLLEEEQILHIFLDDFESTVAPDPPIVEIQRMTSLPAFADFAYLPTQADSPLFISAISATGELLIKHFAYSEKYMKQIVTHLKPESCCHSLLTGTWLETKEDVQEQLLSYDEILRVLLPSAQGILPASLWTSLNSRELKLPLTCTLGLHMLPTSDTSLALFILGRDEAGEMLYEVTVTATKGMSLEQTRLELVGLEGAERMAVTENYICVGIGKVVRVWNQREIRVFRDFPFDGAVCGLKAGNCDSVEILTNGSIHFIDLQDPPSPPVVPTSDLTPASLQRLTDRMKLQRQSLLPTSCTGSLEGGDCLPVLLSASTVLELTAISPIDKFEVRTYFPYAPSTGLDVQEIPASRAVSLSLMVFSHTGGCYKEGHHPSSLLTSDSQAFTSIYPCPTFTFRHMLDIPFTPVTFTVKSNVVAEAGQPVGEGLVFAATFPSAFADTSAFDAFREADFRRFFAEKTAKREEFEDWEPIGAFKFDESDTITVSFSVQRECRYLLLKPTDLRSTSAKKFPDSQLEVVYFGVTGVENREEAGTLGEGEVDLGVGIRVEKGGDMQWERVVERRVMSGNGKRQGRKDRYRTVGTAVTGLDIASGTKLRISLLASDTTPAIPCFFTVSAYSYQSLALKVEVQKSIPAAIQVLLQSENSDLVQAASHFVSFYLSLLPDPNTLRLSLPLAELFPRTLHFPQLCGICDVLWTGDCQRELAVALLPRLEDYCTGTSSLKHYFQVLSTAGSSVHSQALAKLQDLSSLAETLRPAELLKFQSICNSPDLNPFETCSWGRAFQLQPLTQQVLLTWNEATDKLVVTFGCLCHVRKLALVLKKGKEEAETVRCRIDIFHKGEVCFSYLCDDHFYRYLAKTGQPIGLSMDLITEEFTVQLSYSLFPSKKGLESEFFLYISCVGEALEAEKPLESLLQGFTSSEQVNVWGNWSQTEYHYEQDVMIFVNSGKTQGEAQLMLGLAKKQAQLRFLLGKIRPEGPAVEAIAGEIAAVQAELTSLGVNPGKSYQMVANLASEIALFLVAAACRCEAEQICLETLFSAFVIRGFGVLRDNVLELIGHLMLQATPSLRISLITSILKQYIGALDCAAVAAGLVQGLKFLRAPAGLILREMVSAEDCTALAKASFLSLCLYSVQRATVEVEELEAGLVDLLALLPTFGQMEELATALELLRQYQLLLPATVFELTVQGPADSLISTCLGQSEALLLVLNQSPALCLQLESLLKAAISQGKTAELTKLLHVYQQLAKRPAAEEVITGLGRLLEGQGAVTEVWKLTLTLLGDLPHRDALLSRLIPSFLAEPDPLREALSMDLLEACKALSAPALFTLLLDVTSQDCTSALAKGWTDLLLQSPPISLSSEDVARSICHVSELLSSGACVCSVEAASAISTETIQRLEFVEAELNVLLRHFPVDLQQLTLEENSLTRLLEWILLGLTRETAEQEDGFPTFQTLHQLTSRLFTLLERISALLAKPLLASSVSLVRCYSQSLLHQVQTHALLSIPALLTANRLMSNFLTLVNLTLTSDSLAAFFAFEAQGFALLMDQLMAQSQDQTVPLEDEELGSKMVMVNLQGMNFAGNAAGIDWATYKKGHRNKLFTREFAGKEKSEIVLAFDLQKRVELRHVSVGFNLFSTEAADRAFGQPVSVFLEGGDSLLTLQPLAKLHLVPDFAYSHHSTSVFAHNFANSPLPPSHQVRFLSFRMRRPVFSCVESSTLLLKKCSKVDLSVSFISVMAYDLALTQDVPLLMSGVFKLYALKLFSRICKPEYKETMAVIAHEPQVLAQLQASFEMLAALLHLHESWLAHVLSQLSRANTGMADWLLDNLLRLTRGPEHARLVNDIVQSDEQQVEQRTARLAGFVLQAIRELNEGSSANVASRFAPLISFVDVFSSIITNLTAIPVHLRINFSDFMSILIAIRVNSEALDHSKSLSRLLLALIYPQARLSLDLDFDPEACFLTSALEETVEKRGKTGFEETLKCVIAYSERAAEWMIERGALVRLMQEVEANSGLKQAELLFAFTVNARIKQEMCDLAWPERLYSLLKQQSAGSSLLEQGVKSLSLLVLGRVEEEQKLASKLAQDISNLQASGLIQSLLVPLLSAELKIPVFLHIFDPYNSRWVTSLTEKREIAAVPAVPFVPQTCSSYQMTEITKSLKIVSEASEERRSLLSAPWTQVFFLEHSPDCSTWLAFHRALEQRAPAILLFQAESRTRGDINVAIASFKPVPQVPDVLEDEVTAAIPFDKDNFIIYMEDTRVFHFDSAAVPQRNFGEVLCDYEGGGALNLGGEFLWLSFSYDYSTCIDHSGYLTCREKGCVLPGEIKVKALEVWTCQLQEEVAAPHNADLGSKWEDHSHPFALLRAATLLLVPACTTAEELSWTLFQGWVEFTLRNSSQGLQREDSIQQLAGSHPLLSLEYRLNQRKASFALPTPPLSRYPLFELFQAIGGISATLSLAQQSLSSDSGWSLWLQEVQTFFQLTGFFSAFIRRDNCKKLLFAVLSGTAQDQDEAGAIAETYKTLINLLKSDNSTELRLKAVEVGLIERVLARLEAAGKAQKAVPPVKAASRSSNSSHYSDDVSDKDSDKKPKEGTGYAPDHAVAASRWDVSSYLQSKQTQTEQKAVLVEALIAFLQPADWVLPTTVVEILQKSALSGFLEQHMGADSLLEVDKEKELFGTFLRLVRVVAGHRQLRALVEPALPRLKRLADLARTFFHCLQNVETPENHSEALAREIIETEQSISQPTSASLASRSYENVLQQPLDVAYPQLLEDLRLDYMRMKGENGTYQHFYSSQLTRTSATPPPEKMYRVAREIADLSHSLPISHTNSIFVRVDSDRTDLLKAIIMGAAGTPYAHGAFEFDIFLEDSYPNTPPKVNLVTTGSEQVRFNPNLYNCGKVCLSLLGTWRGYATENWDPKISTLLQVLMSIQSMIMTEDVYFNEPGFEQEASTDEGIGKNEGYCNIIRYSNAKYAMLDQIRKPPKGFESVIKRHFYLKREEIVRDIRQWLQDAKAKEAIYTGLVLDHNATIAGWFRDSKEAYYDRLQEVFGELEEELMTLAEPIPIQMAAEGRKQQGSVGVEREEGREVASFGEIDVSDDVEVHREAMDVGNRAVTDRLSRYIGAMGLDAVRAQAESAVLVLGAGALAAEIAKNVVLSGIKRLTIRETPHFVCKEDVSGHCFLRITDIGRVRAEAVSLRLQQLNAYAVVDWSSAVPSAAEVKAHYSAVVVTEMPWEQTVELERGLRESGVAVVAADAFGLFGRVFVDLGDTFAVADTTGEEPQEYVISSISNEAEGLVTLLTKHNLEDGSLVLFSGLQGSTELNGTSQTVKVVNTTSFRIGNTTGLGAYTGGGTALQLRKSGLFRFSSLSDNLRNPVLDETYEWADFEKAGEWRPQHVAMLALDRAIAHPESSESAFDTVLADFEEVDTELARRIWVELNRTAKGTFPPLCSYLGGIAAQEVLKALTHKFTPIRQLLYFNTRELGDFTEPQVYTDPVQLCMGRALNSALAQASVFMVGVGAIGCELLKNLALLGVSTAGKLTITDPDHIENSNLSRQFLFREKHIRMPKAAVAAAAAVDLNPALREHLLPRLDKVHEPTAHIFSESFFQAQSLVLTALDSIQARRYVDSRCVHALTPLLDSGTLGSKGHVQVILPHSTETYSERSDPEDESSIPVCTLKLFPEETVHCIEWALDLFARYFTIEPALVRTCLTQSGADLEGEKLAKAVKVLRKWPQCFEDCIQFAWKKFHKLFSSDPKRLMHVYPADARTSDGKLFWTLPKRPPTAVIFSVDIEEHVEFLLSAACLKARVSGIQMPSVSLPELRGKIVEIARHFPIKQFQLSQEQASAIRAQVDSKEESSTSAVSTDLHSELKDLISSLSLESRPESFEKDNDANGHVDFLHSASNCRAQVYSLKSAEWITVKLKAGRVVPALATTTAVVAALQTIEALKVMQGCTVRVHRNGFINLAASVCAMTEPCAPRVMYELQGIGPVTAWTRWEVPGSSTLQGLFEYIKEHYGVETRDVLQGSKHIYLESLMDLPAKQAEKAFILGRDLKELVGGQEEDLRVHFTMSGGEKLLQSPPIRLCL